MLAHLQQIRKHIQDRGIGITIHELRKLCTDHHQVRLLPAIDSVANNYALMRQFFANGFEDPGRTSLYNDLEHRLYRIILELTVECVADNNTTFHQSRSNAQRTVVEYTSIENALVSYDQELALASLEADSASRQKEIHNRLLRYRIALFDTIYTSLPWSSNDAETMTAVLLSPLIDAIDQQIMLAAMLLAQRTVFDANKFVTLCSVASTSTCTEVRERAVVAIAMALPDDVEMQMYGDVIREAFGQLMAVEGMMQKFTELQLQMFACLDTPKVDKTLNEEIFPTLINNSNNIINPKKTDEENLDALLHPDKEEKIMEDVEAAQEKIRALHENGSDVFFGGFSKTKNFSFFYTLMNWFCPFYIDHPQLMLANFGEIPPEMISKLVGNPQLCSSDRYSFMLSLAHVITQIPKEFVDMMKKGELVAGFSGEIDENPALIRRQYLNDLYRFFNIYSDKRNFSSPFASESTACFFMSPLMYQQFNGTRYPLQVCRNLHRKKHTEGLRRMLDKFHDGKNVEYVKLFALNLESLGEYSAALRFYNKALLMTPDNRQLLLRCGNMAFNLGRYDQAFDFYSQYISRASSDDDIEVEEFRMALCQLQIGLTDEGMQALYRLAYNSSDESGYYEALAWGNLMQKKYEEALKYYDKLEQPSVRAHLRKCIALWMLGRVGEAATELKVFAELTKDNRNENVLDAMMRQLRELHLDEHKTEAMILIDHALLSEE